MTDQKPISAGLAALPAIKDLADTYRLDVKAFIYTFKTMAMPANHSEPEFVSCCLVAREHGLNPLTKEIYFMRTRTGQIQAIVGVDGWIRKCNEHPAFDGLEFEDRFDDKGELVSITCAIYRKDRTRPTNVTEYLDECKAVGGPVWKTSPKRMLRNRALSQGARIAFGFAGIMLPDEFEAWQSVQMRDITPAAAPSIDDIPDPAQGDHLLDIPEDTEADPPIADVDGYLAKMREDVELCNSTEELTEIAEANAAMIARLPKAAQKTARKLLEDRMESLRS